MNQKELAAIIAKCRDENGQITPQAVIDQARDPQHPLHDNFHFDDDAKMAFHHRMEIARQLIKSVRHIVVYKTKRVAAPYYVSDPRTKKVGYVPTVSIKRSRENSMQVLADELSRIKGAIHRAIGLAAAFDLVDPFNTMLSEAVAIEKSLQTWPDADEDVVVPINKKSKSKKRRAA